MKKILITGANSYIGTSFEKYMKEFDGYEIDTVDMIDGSWREKDFSSVFNEKIITSDIDADSIVEMIYIDSANEG